MGDSSNKDIEQGVPPPAVRYERRRRSFFVHVRPQFVACPTGRSICAMAFRGDDGNMHRTGLYLPTLWCIDILQRLLGSLLRPCCEVQLARTQDSQAGNGCARLCGVVWPIDVGFRTVHGPVQLRWPLVLDRVDTDWVRRSRVVRTG